MGWVENKIDQVANIVGDVVDVVVDNVIDPIADLVNDVIEAALSDPIGTIAKVYAISTGQLYLLPYIAAASTAINGGDLGDIVKAAAIATVAQAVGAEVSAYAGTAGTAAELGVNVGSEQATQLALQEAGMGSLTSITNSIAASSLSSAAAAVVTGQDPLAALASGGIGAAVPAALGQIEGFQELQRSSPAVANVITKAITTELQGGDVGASSLNSLIISSGIAAKAINAFDPDKKMTDAERAVATNLIIDTTRAAVKGGDISDAMNASLVSSAVNSLGKIVTAEFKTKVATASSNYETATEIASKMSANEKRQSEIIADYNNIASQIDIRSDEQTRLQSVDAANRAKYEQLKAAGASVDELNAQAAVINGSTAEVKKYATDFSKFVAEVKPGLEASKKELDTLQTTEGTLQTNLTNTLEKQVELTKPVSGVATIATNNLNESFTKIIDPTFNAKEYAEINGLDANVNAYTDFMEKGRDAGAPTNLEAARAEIGKERTRLVNEVLTAKGLSLDTADPATVSKLLDSLDSTYGNNLGELRGASIQDVISGNTRTVEELVADSKKPFRVEVAGSAYGDWKKPAEATFKVPEGYRLATTEEFETKQSQGLLAADGNTVHLVPTGEWGRVVWNEAAGAYEPQSIPVLGLPPTETEVYSVAAKNDKANEGLFTYIATALAGGVGEQLQDYTSGFALTFGIDKKNASANFAQSMIDWGKSNTPTGVAEQVQDIGKKLEAAYKLEGRWNQSKAVFDAVAANPSGYMAYLGKEAAQNIVPIGGGMAAAALAATLGAPVAVGLTAATVFSVVAEGLQVYGNTGKEVYDARIKAGDSEEVARSKAILAGVKSASVAAPVDAVTNALIFAPYLRALGVAANVGLKGTTAVIASTVGEVIEDFTTGAIKELAINPDKPLPIDKLWVNSVFAGMVASGTTGVTIAPAMLDGSLVIGFDNNNKGVTYSEYRADPSVLDISRINTNVVVGKTSDNKNVTLGDLVTSNNATDLNKAVAEATNTSIPPEIERVLDPLITDEAEVRAAFEAVGYKQPTQAEINEYIGKIPEAVSLGNIESKYDPLVTTVSEAQQIAKDLGYTNLTNAEALKLAGQIAEADAKKSIADYVTAHSVSAETAKDLLIKQGITNPTASQIKRFTASGPTVDANAIRAQLEAYADPLAVTREEAIEAYKALGLNQPTEADINKLVGIYSENSLTSKATANLADAKVNTILTMLDTTGAGVNTAAIKAAVSEAMAANPQLTATDVAKVVNDAIAKIPTGLTANDVQNVVKNSITNLVTTGQLTETRSALEAAIADAKATGLQGDAALQAAINKVAIDQNLSKDQLLAKLGTTEAVLRTEFAAGIANLSTDMQAKFDALNAEQKKFALDLVAQGRNTQEAINAAQAATTDQIAGVTAEMRSQYETLTAAQKAAADALIAQGETFQNALTAAQASTSGQIAGLTADMQAKYDALNASQKATADALIAQGETFQSALALAQATTGEQIAGLSADMQAKFDALTAEQKQFALDLVALGNTTQASITAAQNATAAQITSSTTALNTRIDELIAEGKTQQEALQQALTEVNTRIGTQGRAPNQSDLDTLQKMIDGTIPADIRYDTNQDGKITPADYDFLTGVITRPNVEDPFKPGPGSIWSPTGLYGELDEAERARERDRLKLEEQRAKDVEAQKRAAAAESKRAQTQVAGTAAAQALQRFTGSAPQLIQQATQQTSTPIYGGAIKEFDFGAPLDYSFFDPSKEKQGSQTGQQTTKIATGGYLDDLLAENMTADDLLKLLS